MCTSDHVKWKRSKVISVKLFSRAPQKGANRAVYWLLCCTWCSYISFSYKYLSSQHCIKAVEEEMRKGCHCQLRWRKNWVQIVHKTNIRYNKCILEALEWNGGQKTKQNIVYTEITQSAVYDCQLDCWWMSPRGWDLRPLASAVHCWQDTLLMRLPRVRTH